MSRVSKNSRSKEVRTLAIIFVALFGLVAVLVLARYTSDNRQRAASSTGTAKYSFLLPGGGTTMTPGATTTMTIQASGTGQSLIDGFQLIATVTGTVPATMTFTPATITGLSTVAQSVSDVSGGKKLTLAMLTANPQAPFNANGGAVTLGTLSFTAPTSGSMTVTIDSQLSKILQSSTANDLLGMQNPFTFTSTKVTPVPTATARPTMTPVVTTQPTMTPVVTPRPTAIITPFPTIMPTVRPTATPRPTIIVTPRPTPTRPPTMPPIVTPRPTTYPQPSRERLIELLRAWILRWRQSR